MLLKSVAIVEVSVAVIEKTARPAGESVWFLSINLRSNALAATVVEGLTLTTELSSTRTSALYVAAGDGR